MSAGRPPHLITPDEVDTWLADSAVRVVTYHRTTSFAARRILEHGVDIAQCHIGTYGQGFYTATQPDPFFGDAELAIAIRLVYPLRGDDNRVGQLVDSIAERLGAPRGRLTPSVGRGVRRELLRLGPGV